MLLVTITNLHQAFREIKHLDCEQRRDDYRAATPEMPYC